ncbi:MAG: tetratricopeptide repeat protein [Armatimonadota bacterium]
MRRKSSHPVDVWIAVLLAGLTFAIYFQTMRFEFTNLDDNRYVTENPYVKAGLTLRGIAWAFTTPYAANWHPLTWLSHMLDCSLSGLNPGRHHLTNVLLHAANSILLFAVLLRLTGFRWRSAAVAALFAAHPLHVESVAWVAERKDVLSTLFWLFTMLAYAGYVRRPDRARYVLVFLLYVLGLLSKPMLVSLPLVLLAVDYWPLGRIARRGAFRSILIEKIPLLAAALASCVVTFWVQRASGAMRAMDVYPIGARLANAVVAYAAYIVKAIWPVGLACFYPHPGPNLPLWQTVASTVALGIVTAVAVCLRGRRPYILVGWMWYLVTLIPVIGLVQVGRQAMADRYTYVPLVGIFIIAAWAVGDFVVGSRRRTAVAVGALCAILTVLSVSAFVQTGYWRDSITLFSRAVRVTRNNGFAEYNLGCALLSNGDRESACYHVRRALRMLPWDPITRNGLGCDLVEQGLLTEAIECFQAAIRRNPAFVEAYLNLGVAYARTGNTAEAVRSFRKALQLDPGSTSARRALQTLEERLGVK